MKEEGYYIVLKYSPEDGLSGKFFSSMTTDFPIYLSIGKEV
jgi:hypothetical protein